MFLVISNNFSSRTHSQGRVILPVAFAISIFPSFGMDGFGSVFYFPMCVEAKLWHHYATHRHINMSRIFDICGARLYILGHLCDRFPVAANFGSGS